MGAVNEFLGQARLSDGRNPVAFERCPAMKPDYVIELVRSSAKTQDLSYLEGARRLVIELELAGFGKTDWVALDSDLDS